MKKKRSAELQSNDTNPLPNFLRMISWSQPDTLAGLKKYTFKGIPDFSMDDYKTAIENGWKKIHNDNGTKVDPQLIANATPFSRALYEKAKIGWSLPHNFSKLVYTPDNKKDKQLKKWCSRLAESAGITPKCFWDFISNLKITEITRAVDNVSSDVLEKLFQLITTEYKIGGKPYDPMWNNDSYMMLYSVIEKQFPLDFLRKIKYVDWQKLPLPGQLSGEILLPWDALRRAMIGAWRRIGNNKPSLFAIQHKKVLKKPPSKTKYKRVVKEKSIVKTTKKRPKLITQFAMETLLEGLPNMLFKKDKLAIPFTFPVGMEWTSRLCDMLIKGLVSRVGRTLPICFPHMKLDDQGAANFKCSLEQNDEEEALWVIFKNREFVGSTEVGAR